MSKVFVYSALDGVRDPKNTKKSKQSDSFFSEDDFLRIMPRREFEITYSLKLDGVNFGE